MKPEEIKQSISKIYTQAAEREEKDTEILNITYYKEFEFDNANFMENDLFIIKLEKVNEKKRVEFCEIYNKNGELIATVNEKGKIQFTPEYIEKLKQEYQQHFELLKLDDITFKLPEELKEHDVLLEHKELEQQYSDDKKTEKEEEKKQPKEEQEQAIAIQKGIPVNNVLVVRDNSNLYKDHPELERGLIFSRDKDGVVRAEYVDENGNLQPSKYIQPSNTSIRQETISMGKDGEPMQREVPQQVMKTQNLTGRDEDVRDIRINVKFDTYGYLDIEEARQGKNGKWLAHDVEVRGREYNSYKVNELTSIRTGAAEPDKETQTYSSIEESNESQSDIQYDQMYLMQHSDEIIEKFIKEGYQKREAVTIFNYMIGEEALTEKQAKEKVNDNIRESKKEKEQENEEERTPWGDAEARRKR